jgi:hypothetical protein
MIENDYNKQEAFSREPAKEIHHGQINILITFIGFQDIFSLKQDKLV